MTDYIGRAPSTQDSLRGTTLITHDDSANYTPTNAQLFAEPAIVVGGTLTLARNLILPTSLDTYIISNYTVGGFTLTVKTLAGAGVAILSGATMIVKSNGTDIVSVSSGAAGAFYENDQTITADQTITPGKNAGTFGPVSIADGVTVTVPTGSTWSIV